jgi:DNA-binding SARP family transcriptional activator
LYSGPFLAEDLYADWAFMRREQLAQYHVTMCNALTSHALAAGRYAAAAQWAAAMLEADRCNESALRQLMRAYAAEGQRGEALRQYHRSVQVLQAELGVAPMAETTAVFDAVLQGETPPADQAGLDEEHSDRGNVERFR